jgi:hypothetical protein
MRRAAEDTLTSWPFSSYGDEQKSHYQEKNEPNVVSKGEATVIFLLSKIEEG